MIEKIKTILKDDGRSFDAAVNEALSTGWSLVDRGLRQMRADKWMLYAELVKLPEPVEAPAPSWRDAVMLLKSECENAPDCSAAGCQMYHWCQQHLEKLDSPNVWKIPEEVKA